MLPDLFLFPSIMLVPDSKTTFTEGVLDSYAPWLNGGSEIYLSALGSMFETVYGLVVDQGDPDDPDFTPGWSVLLDPDNCPTQFLPYLAQFNGTTVPVNTDDATARSIIKSEAGMQRGTASAITSAAARNLTGTQKVILLERQGIGGADAYSFLLIVRPEEVTTVAAITNAVNTVKPAGVIWTLVQSDGETWAEANRTWASDTTTWAGKG